MYFTGGKSSPNISAKFQLLPSNDFWDQNKFQNFIIYLLYRMYYQSNSNKRTGLLNKHFCENRMIEISPVRHQKLPN